MPSTPWKLLLQPEPEREYLVLLTYRCGARECRFLPEEDVVRL
jgi:hypothetical protein